MVCVVVLFKTEEKAVLQERLCSSLSHILYQNNYRASSGLDPCTAGGKHAPSCSRKGYKCPQHEERFEDMVRKCQQYISHVAEDENLPQEVGDFKELQIRWGIEKIMRERVIIEMGLVQSGACKPVGKVSNYIVCYHCGPSLGTLVPSGVRKTKQNNTKIVTKQLYWSRSENHFKVEVNKTKWSLT